MKKKILLYGVGTYKNRGVEAIMQSTLNQINKKEYDISVATHDYNNNKKYYITDVKRYIKHYKKTEELNSEEKELEKKYQSMPFDYNNFELLYQNEVVEELEKSDICISVGGDNYCYDFCTWLYALDKKANNLNKKTVLWGASLFEEINDRELINDMKNFDVLVIRESLSYNAIKKYIPDEKILYVPDPAFSLMPKKVKLNEWYKKNNDFIVLNLSPLTIKNEEGFAAVIDLVKHILNNTNYSICLLPHVTTSDCNDLTILRKISNRFKSNERVYLEKENYNCNELKYIISKAKILVAARTHATIAAYSQNIPTLVIGYSVKAKGIALDLFGNIDNYVISSNELSTEKLLAKFDYIDKNKEKIERNLKEITPELIEKSKNIFSKVLEKLKIQEKEKICNYKECIGCGLCSTICPKNAITMERNNEGYTYPKINLKKCIECNNCRNNCPILNTKAEQKDNYSEYYAMKSKNKNIQSESTSGGVFSEIAEKIILKNGIVYGCEFKDNKANHVRITNKPALKRIRGSKYIQSNINSVIASIKKDLNDRKNVLFSGTPCQVGMIQKYFGENNPYLLTVSVVCHGVMNDKILENRLEELKNSYNGKLKKFKFRTKENGWTKSSIEYTISNKKIVKTFTEDSLMYLYLKNLLLRESCYSCRFKGEKNKADFILGDYWGIEVTMPDFLDQNGVSFVKVNSEKAKAFIEETKLMDCVVYKVGDKEKIERYNPSINNSVKRPEERDYIFEDINKNTLDLISKTVKNDEELKRLKKIEEKYENLRLENIELANKIDVIYNSRRWKTIDKSANIINKIIRKK